MQNFWKQFKKPIMATAPMSGVSNQAFRLMILHCGKQSRPDVFWTEFVSADGLMSRGQTECLKKLKFSESERPIVAQIFGADPEIVEKACALVAGLGFDGIDINMGCPDRDVEKKGGGAAMMKTPALAKEIIRAAKKGAPLLPISVKTRIGYLKNEIETWIPAILEENVAALTVHFRTRKQMYLPPVNWELAKDVLDLRNKISPETLVLGNGDVKDLAEAKKMATETGLDGIMVGRALIGNPWFFRGTEPTIKERIEAVIKHAEIFMELDPENEVRYSDLKKHFHGYIKGFPGAKELRDSIMASKNIEDLKQIIKSF